MIKLTLLIITALLFSACGTKPPPYKTHKPKARYKPSVKALDKLNKRAIGKRYIWGEERANRGFDCSGLTYYNYGSMGIDLPRVAREQFRVGTPISKEELQKGDLVFFDTSRSRRGRVTHVGIYLGNGKFEHASSSKKRVTISSLNSGYFKSRYLGARRVYSFNSCPKPRIKQEPIYQVAQQSQESVVQREQIAYTTPSTLFANAQKQIDTQAASPNSYYILVNSNPSKANELITKLELSGLPSNTIEQGRTILVGPFSTKAKALEIKNFNPELLANATIKSI